MDQNDIPEGYWDSWAELIGTISFAIGFVLTTALVVARYWNGYRRQPVAPKVYYSATTFRVVIAALFVGLIVMYFEDSDGLSVPASLTTFILFALCVPIALAILTARYSFRVATRTGHSRIGFVWLSILFPLLALFTCLILDRAPNRFTSEGIDTFKTSKN
jgi:FtsH-binding integral membrane protein